jgi:thiamine biosynthesis protein ThiC
MNTQVEQAQRRTITPQMQDIARSEGIDRIELCERITEGSVVIMR